MISQIQFQLSGNIYGIYITEDYCSKSLRLSESWDFLLIEDITRIISNIQLWLHGCDYEKLVTIWKSDATQAMLFGLDFECHKRTNELDPLVQWRLAISFCRLQTLFRCIESRENKSQYLSKLFNQKVTAIDENSQGGVSEMSKEEFILLMSIVSTIDCTTHIKRDCDHLHEIFHTKCLMLFDSFSPEELVICYTAIKKLDSICATKLGEKISAKYGFRF